MILLPLADYVRIREDGRRFLNVPGHDETVAGWARRVEDHGSYLVVEKIGEAGLVAEALDERQRGGRQGRAA